MIEPWLGAVFAVLGLALGIFLARMIRRRRAAAARRHRDATPAVYASRQDLRRAERERRKKGLGLST
jgi:hypothetical protein